MNLQTTAEERAEDHGPRHAGKVDDACNRSDA